jgi:hypothetical protein
MVKLTDEEKEARAAEKVRRAQRRRARELERERTREAMQRRAARFAPRAQAVQSQWAEDREQEEKAARRRARLGLVSEGFDGKFEEGEKTVVDPYETKPLKVKTNIRRNILETELAHGRISEEQKAAGDLIEALFHRAEVGGAQAIDYGVPKVDSCGKGDPLSDAVMAANQRLEDVEARIGRDDYHLLRATILGGLTLKHVAMQCRGPFPSANAKYDAEKYVGRRWRDALTALVDFFGVAPKPVSKGIRVEIGERPTHRPETWETHHVPLHFHATG